MSNNNPPSRRAVVISVAALIVSIVSATFTGLQWYNASVEVRPMQMKILNVVFAPQQPSEFTVKVHLVNPGAPSTIKDCVLTVFVDNKVFEQFPPREFYTAPTLGPILGPSQNGSPVQRGPYLSTEPLGRGREIDASITYTVTGEVRQQLEKPGTRST
jgi:hypothetical protein